MLRQHLSEAKKTLLSENSGTSSGMASKRRMPPKASPVVNAKPQKRSFSSAMITGLLGNKMDDPAFELKRSTSCSRVGFSCESASFGQRRYPLRSWHPR